MGDSVGKNPDYRHSRLLVVSAACGCAILFAAVILVANIFPYVDQMHGWPFVYMGRESRVPGDFSVYYGPWPFDDPPLAYFSSVVLAVNVAVGIVLTLSAALSTAYWLRLSQKPLQFNLRTLLGLSTASAGLAFLATFCAYRDSLVGNLWLLIRAVQIGVYFAPCLPIVTVAHCFLRCPAVSSRKLRWGGLHAVTWIALVAMAGPFIHYSFFAYTGVVVSEGGTGNLSAHGWPNNYVATDSYKVPSTTLLWALFDGFEVRYFNPLALFGNILLLILAVAATAFVVERWVRRTQGRLPVRRGTLPALIVLAGLMYWPIMVGYPGGHRWYDYPSWLFAVACMVFAVEVYLLDAAARGIDHWRRKRELAVSHDR